MPGSLGPVLVGDTFPANPGNGIALLRFDDDTSVTTNVFNFPVFFQFILVDPRQGLHANAFDWDPAQYITSMGHWVWTSEGDFQGRRIAGVRARNVSPSSGDITKMGVVTIIA